MENSLGILNANHQVSTRIHTHTDEKKIMQKMKNKTGCEGEREQKAAFKINSYSFIIFAHMNKHKHAVERTLLELLTLAKKSRKNAVQDFLCLIYECNGRARVAIFSCVFSFVSSSLFFRFQKALACVRIGSAIILEIRSLFHFLIHTLCMRRINSASLIFHRNAQTK